MGAPQGTARVAGVRPRSLPSIFTRESVTDESISSLQLAVIGAAVSEPSVGATSSVAGCCADQAGGSITTAMGACDDEDFVSTSATALCAQTIATMLARRQAPPNEIDAITTRRARGEAGMSSLTYG